MAVGPEEAPTARPKALPSDFSALLITAVAFSTHVATVRPVTWASVEHLEGVAILVFAGAAFTALLLNRPEAAVMKRRLARWWKGRNKYDRSDLLFTGRLAAAITAGILITLAIGGTGLLRVVITVLGIVGGSAFVVVLAAIFVADRIKYRRPRSPGRHAASRRPRRRVSLRRPLRLHWRAPSPTSRRTKTRAHIPRPHKALTLTPKSGLAL